MGNKTSDISTAGRPTNTHNLISEPFRMDDWVFKYKSEYSDVYRHRWTLTEVEIFTVEITQKDDIGLYELRKNTQSSILPRVIHYEVINNPKTLSGYIPSNQHVRVVVQRLPFRLPTSTELHKFHISQAHLHDLLDAYQHTIQKFGNFRINNSMLAFAADGTLRMWINSNFGRNYPQFPCPKEPLEQLIENIFQLTDSLTRNIYNDRKRYNNFTEAFQYLRSKSPTKHVSSIGQTIPSKVHIVRNNSFIPVNIVVMRTMPKVQASESRNNHSGTSHIDEHDKKIGHAPRHAINQLAGLGQNLIDVSRKCSPNIPVDSVIKTKGSSSATTPLLRQVGQEQSKVTTNNSSIKTASPPKAVIRMVRYPVQTSPCSQEANRRRVLGGSVMASRPIEVREQSKPKVHFSFDNAKEQEINGLKATNTKKQQNSLSNSFSKVVDSPIVAIQPKVEKVEHQAESYPLNRNIVFRHKAKQHPIEHRYVTAPNDADEQPKIHVQQSKAINIDDVNYHPLNFLKQQQKKPQLSTVVTIPTTLRHEKVQLYRPETFLPTSQPLIQRENSQPRVSRLLSQRPVQTLNTVTSTLQKKQDSFQSVNRLNLVQRRRVETQENQVQTIYESMNVGTQKDASIKSSSTSQNNEVEDMDGSPLKRILELRVHRQQNRHDQRYSESFKLIQKTDLEPSTESKYNNTDKKEPLTDKKPLINVVKNSSSDQKQARQEVQYAEQTHRTKIQTSNPLPVDTSKEPELPPKIKILYSHLSQNPIKSKLLNQRKFLRQTIAVDPLPLQKISEPLSVAESEHSIPQPQSDKEIQYAESYEAQESHPPQVGFYHQVLNFHQSQHTDSHFLSKPTSYHPNQSTFSPSIMRNIPSTLNEQVVAILYDHTEPKPENPLQYKYQQPQQTIMTNPGGIGFNIAKRETNVRIKKILQEERIKRQDKQNKSSFERLLHDKGESDLTSYLQRKLEERQKANEERQREERRLQIIEDKQKVEQTPREEAENFYAEIVAHHEQHLKNEQVEEYMKDSYVQELQNYLAKHKKQNPLVTRSEEIVGEPDPKRITKQLSFGNNSDMVPIIQPMTPVIYAPEQKKKPISYVQLTQDIRNLLNISQSTRQDKDLGSRKSSKQKTIQQKVLKKRSDFASLKEQVQRILYH